QVHSGRIDIANVCQPISTLCRNFDRQICSSESGRIVGEVDFLKLFALACLDKREVIEGELWTASIPRRHPNSDEIAVRVGVDKSRGIEQCGGDEGAFQFLEPHGSLSSPQEMVLCTDHGWTSDGLNRHGQFP